MLRRQHRISIINSIGEFVSVLHLCTTKSGSSDVMTRSAFPTDVCHRTPHSAQSHCKIWVPFFCRELPCLDQASSWRHPKCLSGPHSILSVCKEITQIIHS